MSHFTVVVVGSDPEKQLAPYDENTRVKRYFRETDWIPVALKEQIGEDAPVEEKLKWFEANFGEKYLIRDGKLGQMSTYNPKSKWDWYSLGGRWTGFFPLKEGTLGETGRPGLMTPRAKPGYVDAALKMHIDFERARNEEAAEARSKFALWRLCYEKHGRPESWDQVHSRIVGKDTDDTTRDKIDEARKFYNGQKAIGEANKVFQGYFGCPVEDFGFHEEVYVDRRRYGALVPFAVVKDGEWYERSKMGWWAVTYDETMSYEDWCVHFHKLVDSLPDDTMLSLYDCHI